MGALGALTPGQVFAGRYRVLAVLGTSATGTVYRVLDTEDPDVCLRLFRANRDAGLIPVLFLAIAALL